MDCSAILPLGDAPIAVLRLLVGVQDVAKALHQVRRGTAVAQARGVLLSAQDVMVVEASEPVPDNIGLYIGTDVTCIKIGS